MPEEAPAPRPAEAFRFCPRCGHGPAAGGGAPVFSCGACGFHLHFNPAVAAGVIVEDGEGRVLLLQRALEPARGSFGLPGGFVDAGEGVEEAIAREAREEAGVEVERLEFVGGWPNLYAWRGLRYPVLDLFFAGRLREGSHAEAGHETDSFVWLRPEEVDPGTLAFATTRAAFARFRENRSRAKE